MYRICRCGTWQATLARFCMGLYPDRHGEGLTDFPFVRGFKGKKMGQHLLFYRRYIDDLISIDSV